LSEIPNLVSSGHILHGWDVNNRIRQSALFAEFITYPRTLVDQSDGFMVQFMPDAAVYSI